MSAQALLIFGEPSVLPVKSLDHLPLVSALSPHNQGQRAVSEVRAVAFAFLVEVPGAALVFLL